MKAHQIARILLTAWVFFCLAPVGAVSAAGGVPASQLRTTVLRVDPLPTYAIGDQPIVVVHLTTDSGDPLAYKLVRIFAYKNRVAKALTDHTGTARILLNFNFYPGKYSLLAAFDGSDADRLASSNAPGLLTMIPGTVQVQTVPPLAGVQFSLEDQTQVTDSNGLVQFSVDHIGGYHLQVAPPPAVPSSNVRIAFDRWNDNDVSTYHEIHFPVHHVVQAGFLINYQVNLRYTDNANQPVDPSRISLTRVRAAGSFYSLTDGSNSVWLPTNYILHRVGSVLETKPATYYLDAVTIAGANVVNQGEQRYDVQPGTTWWIHLFLYPASFSAYDALFRTPLGSGIMLQYPNGTRETHTFDPSTSKVQLASLPRGIYHASVQGSQGLEPVIPLSLSRAREFDLIVISRRDMELLLGVPAAVALLLLVFGRTNLLGWLTPRRRAS